MTDNMLDPTGRPVLVTGSGRGTGFSLARGMSMLPAVIGYLNDVPIALHSNAGFCFHWERHHAYSPAYTQSGLKRALPATEAVGAGPPSKFGVDDTPSGTAVDRTLAHGAALEVVMMSAGGGNNHYLERLQCLMMSY
jgi:hypothetical protein